MAQFFLDPSMLFGAALVSVPIIIYLINRHRYQRRRWAAMEFLLRAMKRNRRRLQLQNLLLLLVRCAIILLLVLAVARPIQRQSAIGILPGGNQNWILAIDDSYSMGYREGAWSLFQQAKEITAQMFEGIIKPGDQVAVMTFGRDPRVVVPPVRINDEARARLLREVEEIKLTAKAVDLGASFTVLDELASRFVGPIKEPQGKQIILFSDLQRKDWVRAPSGGVLSPVNPAGGREKAAGKEGAGPPVEPGKGSAVASAGGPRDPSVLPILDKIQKEGGAFFFAKLSSADGRPNLALTDLSASPALLGKDVWVELRATVRNLGKQDLGNIDLTIQVDRNPEDAAVEPQLGDVIRVSAGETVTRILPYKFTSAGHHTVVAELRSDGLVIDNRRYLVLPVAESVKVLLVDGDPAASPLDRETFHLEVALEPEDDSLGAGGRFTPFETRVVTPEELTDTDWKDPSVVVLANVAELPPDRVEDMKRYVRGGGALMVFLGDNVRPEFYHQFFRGEEGMNLLSGTLEGIHGDKRYPVHLQVADGEHPIPRYFEERKQVTHLERPIISFEKYYRVTGLGESPETRVSFRYSDAERSPAVFDNPYGNGRVLWFTSSADQEWNEFSSWPDFVVFLYESISYLVRFGMSSMNLLIEEPFRKTYPVAQYASEVLLLEPEGESQGLERARSVRKAMKGLPGGNEFEIVHEDTGAPGLYRVDLLRPNTPGGDTSEYFAVNVDTEESDLEPMVEDDFKLGYESLRYRVFDASERLRAARGEEELLAGSEFWKPVLALVLALLFLESVLAFLFGRKTR